MHNPPLTYQTWAHHRIGWHPTKPATSTDAGNVLDKLHCQLEESSVQLLSKKRTKGSPSPLSPIGYRPPISTIFVESDGAFNASPVNPSKSWAGLDIAARSSPKLNEAVGKWGSAQNYIAFHQKAYPFSLTLLPAPSSHSSPSARVAFSGHDNWRFRTTPQLVDALTAAAPPCLLFDADPTKPAGHMVVQDGSLSSIARSGLSSRQQQNLQHIGALPSNLGLDLVRAVQFVAQAFIVFGVCLPRKQPSLTWSSFQDSSSSVSLRTMYPHVVIFDSIPCEYTGQARPARFFRSHWFVFENGETQSEGRASIGSTPGRKVRLTMILSSNPYYSLQAASRTFSVFAPEISIYHVSVVTPITLITLITLVTMATPELACTCPKNVQENATLRGLRITYISTNQPVSTRSYITDGAELQSTWTLTDDRKGVSHYASHAMYGTTLSRRHSLVGFGPWMFRPDESHSYPPVLDLGKMPFSLVQSSIGFQFLGILSLLVFLYFQAFSLPEFAAAHNTFMLPSFLRCNSKDDIAQVWDAGSGAVAPDGERRLDRLMMGDIYLFSHQLDAGYLTENHKIV
ncbi:hypothetical protein MKZ38_005576 [Zalerion maritima]|uniref:Uncharacterized protein n=1 Tax=Zalerion maritima TaxID=339359 RepID=A0AAD5RQR6_9PEZI|nr:hypothetical protein MKZ38_005576 [Zalerion maritima]